MSKPFTCPHCGSHDYVIVLTGCNITGATVEEGFLWDETTQEYSTTGSVIMESESLENADARALCSRCEKDVSDAVTAYEGAQSYGDIGGAQA